jgi:hypothetical protein
MQKYGTYKDMIKAETGIFYLVTEVDAEIAEKENEIKRIGKTEKEQPSEGPAHESDGCPIENVVLRGEIMSELAKIAKRMHSELIDSDGIIDDLEIETFYFPAERIGQCDGYVRIIGDAGAYDFETRILNDALIYWGWTPPTKEFLETKQKKLTEEATP